MCPAPAQVVREALQCPNGTATVLSKTDCLVGHWSATATEKMGQPLSVLGTVFKEAGPYASHV